MRTYHLIIGAALFAAPVATSCGYDGYYRYPCQDPENWENEECQPPICEIGTGCTEDLIGKSSE